MDGTKQYRQCTLLMGVMTALLCVIVTANRTEAAPGRWEREISGDGWRLWLDKDAAWKDDTIHLPPVDIGSLPVNLPTCGWEGLASATDKTVRVPGTVEEHFWSRNGNPNGIAGDYRGVSWWSTTFDAPPDIRGKRIVIAFASVNLRAEVFVNRRLVGYDVIGNTPFEVDVTDALTPGTNSLDVRITDPVGTFSWNDENLLRWGDNMVPSVHGFGGITGKVVLRATDTVRIDDVYIQNQKKPKEAKVFATIANDSGGSQNGTLTLTVSEWNNPKAVVWKKTMKAAFNPGGTTHTFELSVPKAKLWDIRDPNLYRASVRFESADGSIADETTQRFGFRWFDVGEKDGDKRYYLNGRRVFVFAAMTRGFWKKNGMFPAPEFAEKDMKVALDLGFNMMLYHRAIGQPISMDAADESGVLSYEEPGGYLCRPAPDETAQAWRREKLRRMVMRDRSRPSLVIFNIDDLSYGPPNAMDESNIRMVHTLDPSRIITYNCIIAPKIPEVPDDPMKLHMLPFDDTFHYHGWTSPYHLIRYGSYLDEYYRNPRYYLRHVIDPVADMGDSLHPIDKDEIIFYGEEGAIGGMVRLEKIREELAVYGSDGWRENEHLDWYASYSRFLDASGMRKSFPTVDDLTMAIGANMYYFHGRVLENTRIGNKVDSYVLNGWASASTRTDIVDTYRNPVGDVSIIKHYTQPLYVAVKLRDTVMAKGDATAADIFIVNEKDLRGKHRLDIKLSDPDGAAVLENSYDVTILGGEEFGQLLVEGIALPRVTKPGYYTLSATLTDKNGVVRADGSDAIFVADYSAGPGIRGTTAVIDTSGVVNAFLGSARGLTLPGYDPDGPDIDCLVIGAHDFDAVNRMGTKKNMRPLDPIMDRVLNGMTLIILDQPDKWATRMTGFDYTAAKYTGMKSAGNQGRFFAGESALLDGLPKNTGLNWECQVFYRGGVNGLRLDPGSLETIIGLASVNSDEITQALSRVRFGEGEIIITTLPILRELASDTTQSSVAKKLFMNLLERR